MTPEERLQLVYLWGQTFQDPPTEEEIEALLDELSKQEGLLPLV